MLEDYFSYSPYNYTLNNPIRFIDPFGMDVIETDSSYQITGDDIITYLGGLQAISEGQSSLENFMEALDHAAEKNDGSGGAMDNTLNEVSITPSFWNRFYDGMVEAGDELWYGQYDMMRAVADGEFGKIAQVLNPSSYMGCQKLYSGTNLKLPQTASELGKASFSGLYLLASVRNPFGRRGSPAHVNRILQAESRFTAPGKGWKTFSGGSLPEIKFGNRYPDLVLKKGNKMIAIQVGRVTKSGRAISRELKAINDLRQFGTFDHVFFLKY